MTRKTLLRTLLALMNFRDTHVMRYCLPAKFKRPYYSMWERAITKAALEVLARNLQFTRIINWQFNSDSPKIGTTLQIRRPVRFA